MANLATLACRTRVTLISGDNCEFWFSQLLPGLRFSYISKEWYVDAGQEAAWLTLTDNCKAS